MSALAFLPMYDVPGRRQHADALWHALRDAIRAEGLDAPDAVDRAPPRMDGWLHTHLVLGQTCGLPYITRLHEKVVLVGTPDYGVAGCPPGFYHSTLVVRSDDARDRLAQFLGATLALNGTDSQSGYGAMLRAAAPYAQGGQFFGRALVTGSHGAAMQAVALAAADIAAIDSVTWRMSQGVDPRANGLRALATTEPTPGLPFIAAAGAPVATLLRATQAGIARLPAPDREAFGLRGVLPFVRGDYAVIARWLDEAHAVHRLPALETFDPAAVNPG